MDPRKIEALITTRTVALAPTHVMGSVCDMGAIMKVARKHKLKVVEDCAQSCGGRFKGRHVGTIGDLGCFSISAYKIVGGGEGGLVLTNRQAPVGARQQDRRGRRPVAARAALRRPATRASCSAAPTTACPSSRPPSTWSSSRRWKPRSSASAPSSSAS